LLAAERRSVRRRKETVIGFLVIALLVACFVSWVVYAYSLYRSAEIIKSLAPEYWLLNQGRFRDFLTASRLIRKPPTLLVPDPQLRAWSRRSIAASWVNRGTFLALLFLLLFAPD
jgi:hypothetical protein